MQLKITQSAGYDDTTRFSDLCRTRLSIWTRRGRWRAWRTVAIHTGKTVRRATLLSIEPVFRSTCSVVHLETSPSNSDAIISLERPDTFGTSRRIRRSFAAEQLFQHLSREDDWSCTTTRNLEITRGIKDHTERDGRIPANSSSRGTTPRREGARDTRAVGFAADRTRGRRDVRNSCWDCGCGCGCGHLMAPSSPLGEGRAKSRDHRLPLLEIPFPLFLSLCLSLSARSPSPVPSHARQRRSPFNSVLSSSSSSQSDSISSVLNRSCARTSVLSSRVNTCCPSFAIPVLLSRVSSPREVCETSLRFTWMRLQAA